MERKQGTKEEAKRVGGKINFSVDSLNESERSFNYVACQDLRVFATGSLLNTFILFPVSRFDFSHVEFYCSQREHSDHRRSYLLFEEQQNICYFSKPIILSDLWKITMQGTMTTSKERDRKSFERKALSLRNEVPFRS